MPISSDTPWRGRWVSGVRSARFWAAANGADGEPEEVELYGGRVTFSRWGGEGTAPVLLYAIDGWGHVWPAARTINPKKQPELAGFDAAELAWDFFRGRARPSMATAALVHPARRAPEWKGVFRTDG